MTTTPSAAPPAALSPPPARGRTAAPLLFLIADTGGGHRAAANAVAGQLAERHAALLPPAIVDPFASSSPSITGRIADLYSPIIVHSPWLWGFTYWLADSPRRVEALRATILQLARRGLAEVISTLDPPAIVSFHPLLNHLTSAVLEDLGRAEIPLITVITDLVDVHAAWTNARSAAIVAATDSAVARCRSAGVDEDRCVDLGLPVDRSFAAGPPPPAERRALRERLGLPAQGSVLLVSGGGEGSGGLRPRVLALAHAGLAATVVVICGRNQRLRDRLLRVRGRTGARLRVLGFVDNMADWMRASDLLVTKAGPGAIAEALCCGLPLLLTAYLPGQERGNVGWVVSHGVGRYVPRVDDLVGTVRELLRPGSAALTEMRSATRLWARPHAAADIADLVAQIALRK